MGGFLKGGFFKEWQLSFVANDLLIATTALLTLHKQRLPTHFFSTRPFPAPYFPKTGFTHSWIKQGQGRDWANTLDTMSSRCKR